MMVLTVSSLGSACLAFLVQAALARTLTATEYGHFASALAPLVIIAPAVGFGLPVFWLKLYGTEGWAAIRWMRASVQFVKASSLLCVSAALIWAYLGTKERLTAQLMLWMLPVVLAQGAVELASAKFQLEERFGFVAAWQIIQHSARFALVLVCFWMNAKAQIVAAGFGCIAMLVTLGAWHTLSPMRDGSVRLVGHGPRTAVAETMLNAQSLTATMLLRGALPFGISSFLYFAYAQSGLLVVSLLTTPADTGVYSVAVTILSAIYLVPTILYQKLLMPRLHRWAASNDARLYKTYRSGNRWMFWIGAAAGLLAALAAPLAIPAVFGHAYQRSVGLVTLMAVCAPLRFVTTSISSFMTTRDHIHTRNLCAGLAWLCSVVAACLLIPFFGLTGAAGAAVFGEAVWTALAVWTARKHLVAGEHIPEIHDANEEATSAAAASSHQVTAPVSVIVPCYNCSKTIGRAISSIYRQTLRPTEVILVDDCSTDGTREVLRELALTYEPGWIRVLHLENNGGPGVARNRAWSLATQPYIAFLDSDDSWHQQKIAVQYGWMSRHPAAAMTGHPVEQITEDRFASLPELSATRFDDPRHVSRWRILFSNRFTPSSVVVRADVKSRFDETKKYAEDYFMLLELALVDRGSCYLFDASLSYIYKPQFGADSGLSAQIWKIHKGEQNNYRYFRRIGAISAAEWLSFSILSFAKYLRRCLKSRRFA
ncbi:glycosyltransferase [Paraburkholderia madseniana]|uniref:glycosyltransferase n=1 Tax=Paraburkholderia madseniana TaxID=2599607 RepID=UPI0038B76EC1